MRSNCDKFASTALPFSQKSMAATSLEVSGINSISGQASSQFTTMQCPDLLLFSGGYSPDQKFDVNWTSPLVHCTCQNQSGCFESAARLNSRFEGFGKSGTAGNHFCFFGACLFHKLAGGQNLLQLCGYFTTTYTRECHNQLQGWLHMIEFPPLPGLAP